MSNIENLMKVYVVISDDRGMGVFVEGVFFIKAEAQKFILEGSHMHIQESFMCCYEQTSGEQQGVSDECRNSL